MNKTTDKEKTPGGVALCNLAEEHWKDKIEYLVDLLLLSCTKMACKGKIYEYNVHFCSIDGLSTRLNDLTAEEQEFLLYFVQLRLKKECVSFTYSIENKRLNLDWRINTN